jgi:hypothetical protein
VSTPDGQLEDLLCSWPDVVSWFSKSSFSQDPSLHLTGSRGVEALKSVLKLREAWKASLAQLIEGGKVSDEFLDSINCLLAEDNFHEETDTKLLPFVTDRQKSSRRGEHRTVDPAGMMNSLVKGPL